MALELDEARGELAASEDIRLQLSKQLAGTEGAVAGRVQLLSSQVRCGAKVRCLARRWGKARAAAQLPGGFAFLGLRGPVRHGGKAAAAEWGLLSS